MTVWELENSKDNLLNFNTLCNKDIHISAAHFIQYLWNSKDFEEMLFSKCKLFLCIRAYVILQSNLSKQHLNLGHEQLHFTVIFFSCQWGLGLNLQLGSCSVRSCWEGPSLQPSVFPKRHLKIKNKTRRHLPFHVTVNDGWTTWS